MAIHTMRPNGVHSDGGNTVVGGPSNVSSANLDNNDSTYVLMNSEFQVHLGPDISLAGNQRIRANRLRTRISSYGGGGFNCDQILEVHDLGAARTEIYYTGDNTGAEERSGAWYESMPVGGEWDLTWANGSRIRCLKGGGASTSAQIHELYLDFDIQTQPSTSTVAPSGAITTRTPTITWAYNDPESGSQYGYRVKVYSTSQSNPESAGGAVYDSGDRIGGSTNHSVTTSLPDGTYYVYVKVSKNFRGAHWWGAWGSGSAGTWSSFSITDTPGLPTSVTPVNGSTINTSRPTLGGTVNLSTLSTPARLEWQFATDTGFTANVRTITEPVGESTASGVHTEAWPAGVTRIYQGTWYMRCRAIDNTGKNGSWTSTATITVSHPPIPSNLTPTGNITLNYGGSGTVIFDWDFTDPDVSGDNQTAFQVIIERNDTSALVHDSGKITGGPGAISQYSYNIPIGQKDQPLRWKVRLYDQDDVVGSYSGNQLFRASDVPQVNITAPTDSSIVDNARPVFTWTVTLTGGRTLSSGRIRIQEVGAALGSTYDQVLGAVLTHQPATNILENGKEYTVQVDGTDNTALSGSDTNGFIVQFDQPRPVPNIITAETYDQFGYVLANWTDAAEDAEFLNYNVYRREAGAVDWELVGTTDDIATTYAMKDQLAGSNKIYEYAVTQEATRFGLAVESPRPGESRVPSIGFEISSAGWTLDGAGGSATRILTDGAEGSAACVELIDTSTSQNSRIRQTNNDDTLVSPGEIIVIELDLKMLTVGTVPEVSFIFSDATNTQEFNITGLVLNTWTHIKRSFVVPAGKTAGYIQVAAADTATVTAVGQVRVDNIQVYGQSLYVQPISESYWLIDPDNADNSVGLHYVTADSFSDEYEEAFIPVINRGRKHDIGTELGFVGQLSIQVRDIEDGKTAREQIQAIHALKRARKTLYLRNPFGDVFTVSAGQIQIDRVPGVGMREYATVTLPYAEIS